MREEKLCQKLQIIASLYLHCGSLLRSSGQTSSQNREIISWIPSAIIIINERNGMHPIGLFGATRFAH